MTPDEIITAPFTIWLAPAGTAFPALSEEPGEDWTLLGSRGTRSFAEGGVTTQHQRQIEQPLPAGNSAPSTSFVSGEAFRIRVEMFDLTLDQYAQALGQNAVVATSGTGGGPGYRTIGLSLRPRANTVLALLARGPSPYDEDLIAQYEVPRCKEAGGGPQLIFRKGQPTGVTVDFLALEDPDAVSEDQLFGRLRAQDESAFALPVFAVGPIIEGTAQVGSTLSVAVQVDNGNVGLIEWLRDGVVIAGANAASYALVEADEAALISVRVTGTGVGGELAKTSVAVGPVAERPVATPAFASVRMPPENGELNSAATGNGGLYIANTADLLKVSVAGDKPLFASAGAIAGIVRFPVRVYSGIRRGPIVLGNFTLNSGTANRRISVGLISGADNGNLANRWKFRVRLIGEGGSFGTVDIYSAALPVEDCDTWLWAVRYDGTNFVVDAWNTLTGAKVAGTSVAKPGGWAGIATLTGDLGIGVARRDSSGTLASTFPQDDTNVFGHVNIGYLRGEVGGTLFLEEAGSDAEWEDMALGADPATIWTDTIRAWYPMVSGGALSLAPVKNLASNVVVGNLAQLGTVLPGSTLRRQTEAKYLSVKNLPDPAICGVRRATLDPANPGAARGWFTATLTMAGQSAGQNIEALIWRASDNAVVLNWGTVGTSVASGDVTVRADLPPGTYRARFRIGSDVCEFNADIVVAPVVLVNGQSQARYVFGLYLTELGVNTVLNTQWDAGVGERTYVAAKGNTSSINPIAIWRAALTPAQVGDGIVAFANTIAASPDYPADWPIVVVDTSIGGTTIEDTLETGGTRDMSDIYDIVEQFAGRDAGGQIDITSWVQYWHSSGSVTEYAQTFIPPMLDGTTVGSITPDDYFRSGLVIDPAFDFLHMEPNRNINTVLGASSNTDSRTEHLVRANLRQQEPNYDYTIGAPCDVHRLTSNVFTHPDQNQTYGSPWVAEITAKSVLRMWGFAGGWAGPVAVASAQFTDGTRNVIDVTFTGPAGFALGVLNAGAISGFEVANDRSTFSAAIVGTNVVRLTKSSGSWSAGATVELKPGGPGDYGTGFDEAAFMNGALINTADGMLVRGTDAPVTTGDAA